MTRGAAQARRTSKAQPPLPDPSLPTPGASPRQRWHRSRTTTTRQAEAGAALPKAEHARPQRLTGDTGCQQGERKRGRGEEKRPVRGGMAQGNKRVAVSHHARVKVAVPRAVLRRRQGGHTYPTHHGRGHGRRDCRCQQQRREKKKHRRKTERHRAHGGRERHRRWGAPGRLRRPGIAEREGGRVDRRGPPTGGWWAGTRAAAHPKRLAGRDAATPTATRAGRPGRCRGRRWRTAPTPAVRKRRRTRRGRADRLGQWRATGRRSARTAAGRTRQEGNNARWRGGRVDGGQGAGAGGRWGGRHRRRVGQGGGDQHHKQTKEGTAGTKRVKKKRGGAKKKRTECRVHRDTPMPTTITTDVSRRTHP